MSSFDTIRSIIGSFDVVDAHEHHIGGSDCKPADNVCLFLTTNYIWTLLRFTDSKLVKQYEAESDDYKKYLILCKLWKNLKYTANAKIVTDTLESMGISKGVIPENYDAILSAIKKRSVQSLDKLNKDVHVKRTLTHYLGHGSLGGTENVIDFIKGNLIFEEGIESLLSIEVFTEFGDFSEIKKLGDAAGNEVGSLTQLESCIDKIVDDCVRLGVPGLKGSMAYSEKGLYIQKADRADAERDFEALRKGRKSGAGKTALFNYLVYHMIRQAQSHNIPVAFHTGYLQLECSQRTNVKNIVNVFNDFPEVKFDIYHLNYPYFENLLEVAKSYSNVYCNTCWTMTIDPEYARNFLRHAIGTIPSSHVFGFGGDYAFYPEFVAAHLKHALDIIASVLAEYVDSRYFSLTSAVELAKDWLYNSPNGVYTK